MFGFHAFRRKKTGLQPIHTVKPSTSPSTIANPASPMFKYQTAPAKIKHLSSPAGRPSCFRITWLALFLGSPVIVFGGQMTAVIYPCAVRDSRVTRKKKLPASQNPGYWHLLEILKNPRNFFGAIEKLLSSLLVQCQLTMVGCKLIATNVWPEESGNGCGRGPFVEIWISGPFEGDRKWLVERPQVNVNNEEFLVLHLKNPLSAIEEKGRRQRHQ